jgi:NADH-quinone oxidoreductase subunit I
VTMQYPLAHMPMPERFRGHIMLLNDAVTGEPKCTACLACQKACPSQCIVVEGVKVEGRKGKLPTKYTLDFTTCSLCGLCVESCNFDALAFSKEYNVVGTRREEFQFDLLQLSQKKGKS